MKLRLTVALIVLLQPGFAVAETALDGERATPQEAEGEAVDQDAGDKALEEQVRAILARPVEDEVDSERCLNTTSYRRVEVLDNRRLAFHGRGDRVWLNQLRMPCVGLRSDHTLSFELRSNQVCAMDTFRGLTMSFGGPMPMGPSCFLGEFEPITKAQVTLLKDALKQQRDAARKARRNKKAAGDDSS